MFFSLEPNKIEQEVSGAPEPKREITPVEIEKLVGHITELDGRQSSEIKFNIYDQGPWSYSKMKCLKKCPFQYYLKYILKFKLPAHFQLQDDPLSANLGKAAHQILEYILKGENLVTSYAKAKKEYVGGKILTEEEWVNGVDTLNYNITRFSERIDSLARRHPISKTFTEYRLAITRDYKPTSFFSHDVWIRGVIDLVLLMEANDILIIDHKKGGGQQGTSTKNYDEQLNWYKLMFHFGVKNIEGAQSAVHFIEAGEIGMGPYHDVQAIENQLVAELEWALNGAIDTCKELGFFKHVRGPQCKWCEYDQVGCKSGQLKNLEKSTKRFFEIKKI